MFKSDFKFNKLSLHPYFFALYPVLFLYYKNQYELYIADLIYPAVVILSISLILQFILRFIYKDGLKSAISLSLFTILFFSYQIFENYIFDFAIRRLYQYLIILLFITLLYIITSIFIYKLNQNTIGNLNIIFSIISISLLIMVIVPIIKNSIKHETDIIHNNNLSHTDNDENLDDNAKHSIPDIYYIILDAHASSRTLKTLYEYSNSEFENKLKSLGFYIADNSHSNYAWTKSSLSSSLNMEYTHYSENSNSSNNLIKNSKVSKYLKAHSYKYVYIGAGNFNVSSKNRYADYDMVHKLLTELSVEIIKMTPVFPLGMYFFNISHSNRVLEGLKSLQIVKDFDEPTFTFAHFLVPHDPFIFRANGETVSAYDMIWKGNESKRKKLYTSQLKFIDKEIVRIVRSIVDESIVPPIIILQGDHGPHHHYRNIFNIPDEDPKIKEAVSERFSILNAYYLPEGGNTLLYKTISPINTFRLVLNHYFSEKYPLLPDKSFVNNYAGYDEKYVDITDDL